MFAKNDLLVETLTCFQELVHSQELGRSFGGRRARRDLGSWLARRGKCMLIGDGVLEETAGLAYSQRRRARRDSGVGMFTIHGVFACQ